MKISMPSVVSGKSLFSRCAESLKRESSRCHVNMPRSGWGIMARTLPLWSVIAAMSATEPLGL